jgi:hypothetical protein
VGVRLKLVLGMIISVPAAPPKIEPSHEAIAPPFQAKPAVTSFVLEYTVTLLQSLIEPLVP